MASPRSNTKLLYRSYSSVLPNTHEYRCLFPVAHTDMGKVLQLLHKDAVSLFPYHASPHTYIHNTYIHTHTTSIAKRPTKCLHFMGHKSNLTFVMELGNKTCYTERSRCEGLKNERWSIIQHNTDTVFHITHIGPRRILSIKKCFVC